LGRDNSSRSESYVLGDPSRLIGGGGEGYGGASKSDRRQGTMSFTKGFAIITEA